MSSRTHLNVSIMHFKRYAVVGIIALNKKTPYNPKQLFWQRSDSAVIDGPESCVCCACSEFVEKRRERASERGREKKTERQGRREREGERLRERERDRERLGKGNLMGILKQQIRIVKAQPGLKCDAFALLCLLWFSSAYLEGCIPFNRIF